MNAKGTKLASNPKFLPADYKTWARRRFWKVHEVARLVIGHNPVQPHPRKVMFDDGTDSPEQSVALRNVEDILDRCIKTGMISERLNPHECVILLQRHGVDVPDQLTKEVEAAVEGDPDLFGPRESKRIEALQSEVKELKRALDERSIVSLHLILMGIVKQRYQSDKQPRGVVGRIIRDIELSGVLISEGAVRARLAEAKKTFSESAKGGGDKRQQAKS